MQITYDWLVNHNKCCKEAMDWIVKQDESDIIALVNKCFTAQELGWCNRVFLQIFTPEQRLEYIHSVLPDYQITLSGDSLFMDVESRLFGLEGGFNNPYLHSTLINKGKEIIIRDNI